MIYFGTTIKAPNTSVLVKLLFVMSIALGMANAEICSDLCGNKLNKNMVCVDEMKLNMKKNTLTSARNPPITMCVKRSKASYRGDLFQSGGDKIFKVRSCGACPTLEPTAGPTPEPTTNPTPFPTREPSSAPTSQPSSVPTQVPTPAPTPIPTVAPTPGPTTTPSSSPSTIPSSEPSRFPSSFPSVVPSAEPSIQPSLVPSHSIAPSEEPTKAPSGSTKPSSEPSVAPSRSIKPSSKPSAKPSVQPSPHPSLAPSAIPSVEPTLRPTAFPSTEPSSSPSSSTSPSYSSSPTIMCAPNLDVISDDPILDFTFPAAFTGLDDPDSWQGYQVNNMTLESYTIHVRFRLDQTRDDYEQTLVHFRDDEYGSTLDLHYRGRGDIIYEQDALELYEDHTRLFDGMRFDLRTNCWVDLKITRNQSDELMKFLINDGVRPIQSSEFYDEDCYHCLHNARFFDYHTGSGSHMSDVNGEIEFIKLYNGVVEDLTVNTIPSSSPSLSVSPSASMSPSSQPSLSLSPSSAPSSNPTYDCEPTLEVNSAVPLVEFTTPASFAGVDDSEGWQGYQANVTLDSYSIHMRFRLDVTRRPYQRQTLIHFREDNGAELNVAKQAYNLRDRMMVDFDALELHKSNERLFDHDRFELRTNCWVDLKISRHVVDGGGEMKFLINDGINPTQSYVSDDSSNFHTMQGPIRFFDRRLPTGKHRYDSNGDIKFIKIYEGVVEDLTAAVLI